ncbi:MAG: protein BatD [Bacteroidetes bacterium]|nr:protein BatD [Bacteroidota bacterium]
MKYKALIYFLFISVMAISQNAAFVAQVSKNKVQVGETFQIAFTINTNASNLKFPNFSDFEIQGGPNQSTSITMVNGSFSQTITYSIYLAAKKEGKFTIGSASIMAGTQKLETKPITIEVSKAAASQQAQGSNSQPAEKNQYASPIDNDDLFIRSYLNKTKSYLGEQIVLTQKVYSRVSLVGFQDVKFPAFNGFWSQTDNNFQSNSVHQENLDGITYNVVDLQRTYLFPQRAGTLNIEPTELECVVRRQVKHAPRNVFEQFFGSSSYEDVVIKIKGGTAKVDVSELPEQNKPEGFNGAVGDFNFKTEINKQEVKANEPVNLKITLSGKGNIKLIEPPQLNLRESFEVYDPKINEKINTNGGVSGAKVYDYLIIPRESGEFKLENLQFSFFNAEKKQYVTIPSPDISLHVLPGDPNSSAQVMTPRKNHIDERENDIRYIKTGDLALQQKGSEFFSSWTHYILLILPGIAFAGLVYYRRKQLILNSDVVAVKQRKAAKMAKKQLVVADKHMKAHQKELFFNEVDAALNRYISHKLNIPVADLSRESIKQNLVQKQVKDTTLQKLFETLDTCEYARYAPGAVSGDLQQVYNNTIELITSLEEEIKPLAS